MRQFYYDDRLSYTNSITGISEEFITDDFGNAHQLSWKEEMQNIFFLFAENED